MYTLFEHLRILIKTKGAKYVWDWYQEQIIKHDKNLKAFTQINEQYHDIETSYPLSGIPIAYKDNICTNNLYTTCGSLLLDKYQAGYNAHVVQRLEDAGLILIGKTNLNEFAMGSDTNNDLIGQSKHNLNIKYGCGGSSGGSAVAVASNMAPVALGTDTGGSVRHPAHLCGIVGVKPTYGTVSRYGIVSYGCSLDQVGVLTHYVQDAAEILNIISGLDPCDQTTKALPSDFFTKQLTQSVSNLKVGVDKKLLASLPYVQQNIFTEVIQYLQTQNSVIVDISLPDLDKCLACYYAIAFSEGFSNLTRFDGVNFGHNRLDAVNIEQVYELNRSLFYDRTKLLIIAGAYFLQTKLGNKTIFSSAQSYRRSLCNKMHAIYKNVDCILLPSLDRVASQNNDSFLEDKYTVLANLTGEPAITIPISKIDNMPYGIQFMAPRYQDALMLQIAFNCQNKFNLTEIMIQ